MVDASGFVGGVALVAGVYACHGNVRHDGRCQGRQHKIASLIHSSTVIQAIA